MKTIYDSIQILYTIIVAMVIGAEGVGTGPEKKATATARTLEIIDEPGGIEIPAWLRPILVTIIPVMIDLVVAQLNRLGFFAPSSVS